MTATCKSVLVHLVEKISQAASDDPLHQCTIGSGFDSVSDLLSLCVMEIASLTSTGSKKPL